MEASRSSGVRRPSRDRDSSLGPLPLRPSPQDRCIPVLWYALPNLPYPCAHADPLSTGLACMPPGSLPVKHMRIATDASFCHLLSVCPPNTPGARGRRAGDSVASRRTKPPLCWTDLLRPQGLLGLAGLGSPHLHPMIACNLPEIADTKSE